MNSSFKTYLLGILIASIFCWIAWILIIIKIDPYLSDKWFILLFFISLFFGLVGIFSLIGFYLRFWLSRNEIIFSHFVPSIRQAFLVSLCIVALLGLQILRLVNIWTGTLLVIAILSLELFFRAKKEKIKRRNI